MRTMRQLKLIYDAGQSSLLRSKRPADAHNAGSARANACSADAHDAGSARAA